LANLSLDVSVARTGFRLAVQTDVELDGITALFGPSGAGKTTLLRVIAGLEDQAVGHVAFDENVWQRAQQRVPAHRRRVGYVFQDGRLFSHLTVERNLRFALDRARRRAGANSAIGIADVIAALDLKSLLARQPRSLSGGEQQRVAIGRALLTSPQLLLMDEPLSSLDTSRKLEILPYIEKLPSAFNLPVLYVTHNVDEVARLAANVLLLVDGRIAAHGNVADVLERIDLWTFTGGREAGAVLQARVQSERSGIAALNLGVQVLYVPMTEPRVGAALRIRIHARDVAIATLRPRQLSIRNVLNAQISRIDRDASVYVELLLTVDGQHLRARITRDALEELRLEPGQEVFALVKSVALESTLLG
jgi:molybdate transport system ATP-binding protein